MPAALLDAGVGQPRRRLTVVSFHAHPDDEALLAAGTLAGLAAAAHRVVIVTATLGEQGLAEPVHPPGHLLARVRLGELTDSALAIGAARLVVLGYADSGMDGRAGGSRAFAVADVEDAAAVLAGVLEEERADVLTVYDAAGGYGHPDHVRVHQVGLRAAQLAGTPVVWEVTVDRRLLLRATAWLPRLPGGQARRRLARSFADPQAINLRVDVRHHADAKRAALAAHRSQQRPGWRTVAVLLALPGPVFRRALGTEWFVARAGVGSEAPR